MNREAQLFLFDLKKADDYKIFDNVNINWDNLEDFELIQNMAKDLSKKIDIDSSMPEEVFEKTFWGWYHTIIYLE
jgi:hypothetical protein